MKWNWKNITLILIFLLLQIVWFNHISLFGKYTPVIYLYPFLILPVNKDESINLITGFFAGLILDIFTNTGGVFAATTVLLIFLKKNYFLINKNPSQDVEEMQVSKLNFIQKTIFFGIFIFIGLIFIYLLDSFSFKILISKFGYILINTLISLFFYIFIDALFTGKET